MRNPAFINLGGGSRPILGGGPSIGSLPGSSRPVLGNDDQQVTAVRFDNWKLVFKEQRARGTMKVWSEPFVTLRTPKLFNLRTDPYERADVTSNTYYDWFLDHVFLMVPAQDYVGEFLATFKEYPQRQKAASFNLDEVLKTLQESAVSK